MGNVLMSQSKVEFKINLDSSGADWENGLINSGTERKSFSFYAVAPSLLARLERNKGQRNNIDLNCLTAASFLR